MNQRDQDRYERHRSEQHRDEQQQRGAQRSRGEGQGRYGSMPGSGQRQQSRAFTDTYNPEPQWLHEDTSAQRYGQPLGGGDYDRNDEDYRGGRYAMTGQERSGYRDEDRGYAQSQGRQYGASQQRGGQAGSMGYGREYGQDRGYGQRMGARWEEDHPEFGQGRGATGSYGGQSGSGAYGNQYGGSRFDEEGRGSRSAAFGSAGAARYAAEYSEGDHRGQGLGGGQGYGAEYGQRGSRSGLQFASDYGSGGYDQVSGGYGYRGSQATGDYQSGMEGQRSYRGLGPQTYKRSDDRIRDDVCERLTDDFRIDASNITIDVNQGAVTLSGTVPERHMRYAAEDLVDDAMGVESINNQLRVQSRTQSQGMQSQGMQSSSDPTLASGSRASAPSEMEKQKH